MTLNELDLYFKSFLHLEEFDGDPSKNGLQIQNSAPDTKPIRCVAFAVDACLETAQRAIEAGADLLFTHHGLFWSGDDPKVITGAEYKKLKTFFDGDLALWAAHVPLDAHPAVGNNAGLAALLDLTDIKSFGLWRKMSIGFQGLLPQALSIEEVATKLLGAGEKPFCILPFGKKTIKSVGIISGGAGGDVWQALEAGLDCYITGAFEHECFHYVKESGINVVALGHYQSETIGVRLVAKKLESEKGIKTLFIDAPTGL